MQPSFLPCPVGPRPRGFGALLGDSLRRPGGRRAVSALTAVLVLVGFGLLSYPAVTDFLAHQRQGQLRAQFNNPIYQQEWLTGRIKTGQGLTELQIPKLHVDVLVVEGVTEQALTAGAGHYPGSALPCARGNVAIAGHRTTYGRPFNQLDLMKAGDLVVLITPFQRCTYRVLPPAKAVIPADAQERTNPFVVSPWDYSVVGQQGVLGRGHFLTLTTCDPPGSAAFRLILRLTLVRTQELRPMVPGPTPTQTTTRS